jgi:hypothetical protein
MIDQRFCMGELKELKPEDSPEPLGNFDAMFHYVDANLIMM